MTDLCNLSVPREDSSYTIMVQPSGWPPMWRLTYMQRCRKSRVFRLPVRVGGLEEGGILSKSFHPSYQALGEPETNNSIDRDPPGAVGK